MELTEKFEKLKGILKTMESAVVAFSGGTDSTFLLKVCHDIIGKRVLAITARSSAYPERELFEAADLSRLLDVQHLVIVSEELEIPGFKDNPPDRCYHCKKELFSKINRIAREQGYAFVLDGTNADDQNDYRPGRKAILELGVSSPLKEAGLTKEDIRVLSKELGLPTWNKPAFACLSSRFPYGDKISPEKLKMVEKAEQFLLDNGFCQVRVRHHGNVARIEVVPEERERFFNLDFMDKTAEAFADFGFQYTALDLRGYRTGSMNEVLDEAQKKK